MTTLLMVERLTSNVFLPSLPALVAHINDTVYLGRHLTTLISTIDRPEEGNSLLNEDQLLVVNVRLLFHKDEETRHNAGNNLKCLLSQETDSANKLPRFSDVIGTDFSALFREASQTLLTRQPCIRDSLDNGRTNGTR